MRRRCRAYARKHLVRYGPGGQPDQALEDQEKRDRPNSEDG